MTPCFSRAPTPLARSDSPKRVLYVYSGKARPTAGGLDLVARQQVEALVEAGHQVTFVSRGRYEHPLVTNITFRVTPANLLSSLPARYYYNAQHRFFSWLGASLLLFRKFDLVVSWVQQSRSLFAMANKRGVRCLLNCPVTHFRGKEGNAVPPHLAWPHVNAGYLEEEYRRADLLLTASDFARNSFLANGISPEKVFSIGRAADPQRFVFSEKPSTPFRVLFFGLVCDRKGIFQALEAWRAAAINDGELWIIGNVPKEIREELLSRLPANAKLMGHRNDPEKFLSQCHVQILPTRLEGMAKSLVEGAACGLVTLTTEESGFPVIDGETGFFIKRDDIQGMAKRLRTLASDPERLAYMARQSAEYVREQLTWSMFRRRFLAATGECSASSRDQRSANG